MNKFSRFYLSGSAHDNAVQLATIYGAGTSIKTNICIQDFKIPLTQSLPQIEEDQITDLGDGTVEFSVSFYPFLLTNISKNGKPYYFQHILKNGKYPYNVKLYDSTGATVDPARYYLAGSGPNLILYHNMVNAPEKFYYVEYVRVTPQGFIDYGFRELLNSTPVYQETSWEDLLPSNPNFFYVDITEDDIKVRTQAADAFYTIFDNSQLVFFQADFKADQHWWLVVRKFAYKLPNSTDIYTTKDLFDYEEFYPMKGMNVIREKGFYVNDVIFLSAHPVVYTPVEFPILNVANGQRFRLGDDEAALDPELPIRSLDRYSGAVELNTDVLSQNTADDILELSYFVEQNYIVLDRLKTGLQGDWYPNFNPAFNADIIGKYTLVYLRKNEGMDTVHFATFQNKSINGITDFYLVEVSPHDSNFTSNINVITLSDFMRIFDILSNPDLEEAVLFLGAIILHNADSNLTLFQKAEDERVRGGGLLESTLEEALDLYPESQYNWELQPMEGDLAPVMTSFLMIVPPEILTKIEKDDILTKVRKFSSVSSFTTILTEENDELILAE